MDISKEHLRAQRDKHEASGEPDWSLNPILSDIPADDWQAIKTAPRDGTRCQLKRMYQGALVSVGLGYFGTVTIRYEDGESKTFQGVWIHDDGARLFPTPTHWKPALAAPPVVAQEEVAHLTWLRAALLLGESLSSVGPDGYYSMTPQQWYDWARAQVSTLQAELDKAISRAVTAETRNTPKGTLAAIRDALTAWSPGNENIKQGYLAAAVRDVLQVMVTARDNSKEAMAQLDAAEAQLHAEIENHREWYARATTQVSGLQAQLRAVQQIVSRVAEEMDGDSYLADSDDMDKWISELRAIALPKESPA